MDEKNVASAPEQSGDRDQALFASIRREKQRKKRAIDEAKGRKEEKDHSFEMHNGSFERTVLGDKWLGIRD